LSVLLAFASGAAHAIDKLSICYDKALTPLIALAKLQDFYAVEGLDVVLHHYPSGRQGLEAMFAGGCTLASAAETPVAHYSLYRKDFLILATHSTADSFEGIIVRSDRGILVPADLRGRAIAVPKLTVAHYFLDLYLLANGLAMRDVKPVYLLPQEVGPAFRRGEVDAATFWQPDIRLLAEDFGARAKVFAAPGLHVVPFMLLGGRDYVRKNPDAVKRVIRALLRAEAFARKEPAKAKVLLANAFNLRSDEMNAIWSLQERRISLAQSLPFLLENAARWEIGSLPAEARPAIPDYRDFIYLDGLLAVAPERVTVIH